MEKPEQRNIAQLVRDLGISTNTAKFIYNNKTIPDDSKLFPSDTPVYDLINIKVNEKNMQPEDAYISVYVELGIREHTNTATIVYV